MKKLNSDESSNTKKTSKRKPLAKKAKSAYENFLENVIESEFNLMMKNRPK